MDTSYHYYHYITGYVGIILGAIAWWFIITYLVNKLRAHFNVRSLWLINRIIAVLLSIMALVGLFTAVKSLIQP